ncbi:hypothetical protein OsJ_21284 [Oryza sativa Japonica Group]|uniref:Uncharacterized protein n=1 Tax=Oryza sativa subsp. japonica TaxID=39947 RepID=A3BBL0_ORYSJ|nr:hypothetical protein OsJ_21284 [Oryza sativa Japonica Group]
MASGAAPGALPPAGSGSGRGNLWAVVAPSGAAAEGRARPLLPMPPPAAAGRTISTCRRNPLPAASPFCGADCRLSYEREESEGEDREEEGAEGRAPSAERRAPCEGEGKRRTGEGRGEGVAGCDGSGENTEKEEKEGRREREDKGSREKREDEEMEGSRRRLLRSLSACSLGDKD